MIEDDLYKVLGVAPEAEDFVIRAAYKALVQRYHPDRWEGPPEQAHQRMSAINCAYDTLGDPDKRKAYDHHWRQSRIRSPSKRQASDEAYSRKPPRPKRTSPQKEDRKPPKSGASATSGARPKPPPPKEKSSWFNWQSALIFAAIVLAINFGKSWVSGSTYNKVAQGVASRPISTTPSPVQPSQPTVEWQAVAPAPALNTQVPAELDPITEAIQIETYRLAAGDVNSHYEAFWAAVERGDRQRAFAFGPNLYARFEAGVANAEEAGDLAAANSIKEFRDEVAEALGRLQSMQGTLDE